MLHHAMQCVFATLVAIVVDPGPGDFGLDVELCVPVPTPWRPGVVFASGVAATCRAMS